MSWAPPLLPTCGSSALPSSHGASPQPRPRAAAIPKAAPGQSKNFAWEFPHPGTAPDSRWEVTFSVGTECALPHAGCVAGLMELLPGGDASSPPGAPGGTGLLLRGPWGCLARSFPAVTETPPQHTESTWPLREAAGSPARYPRGRSSASAVAQPQPPANCRLVTQPLAGSRRSAPSHPSRNSASRSG